MKLEKKNILQSWTILNFANFKKYENKDVLEIGWEQWMLLNL